MAWTTQILTPKKKRNSQQPFGVLAARVGAEEAKTWSHRRGRGVLTGEKEGQEIVNDGVFAPQWRQDPSLEVNFFHLGKKSGSKPMFFWGGPTHLRWNHLDGILEKNLWGKLRWEWPRQFPLPGNGKVFVYPHHFYVIFGNHGFSILMLVYPDGERMPLDPSSTKPHGLSCLGISVQQHPVQKILSKQHSPKWPHAKGTVLRSQTGRF